MRIVVIGATGNVGTAVVRALRLRPEIGEIVGVARRRPASAPAKTTYVAADVARTDLAPILRGADVVIHLAWLIQPSRDERTLEAVNVEGTRRVAEATATAGVPTLVYASSVGAYSPAPKDPRTDESWPTDGIATSAYSRQKAATERMLDAFETRHPEVRAVPAPTRLVRTAVTLSWKLRLQPTPAGWLDLALAVPILDTRRARRELGWAPRVRADDALAELLAAIRDGEGHPTPPLEPAAGGPLRVGELLTGIGARV